MAYRLPPGLQRLLDVAVAGAMAFMMVGVALVGGARARVSLGPLVPMLWVLSQSVPLLWRRRAPAPVLTVVVAGSLGLWALAGTRPTPLATMIALYTVASLEPLARSLRALAVASLIGIPYVLDTLPLDGSKAPFQLLRLGFEAAVVTAAWLAGEMVRARRAHLAELEARAERLEREREQELRRAAAEEQARIARELHDVIAHNVSVMVVQASAADEVFDERPERAREALRAIDRAGRDALAELRRLLAGIRPDEAALEPQPSLDRLDALAARVRAGGLPVTVRVVGDRAPLPAGIELSAYRIVQEALTNSLRHARACAVDVQVRYANDALELTIEDDGVGACAANAPAGGHAGNGIVGMRERVALTGGELAVGPRPGGGFRVHARLPLREAAR